MTGYSDDALELARPRLTLPAVRAPGPARGLGPPRVRAKTQARRCAPSHSTSRTTRTHHASVNGAALPCSGSGCDVPRGSAVSAARERERRVSPCIPAAARGGRGPAFPRPPRGPGLGHGEAAGEIGTPLAVDVVQRKGEVIVAALQHVRDESRDVAAATRGRGEEEEQARPRRVRRRSWVLEAGYGHPRPLRSGRCARRLARRPGADVRERRGSGPFRPAPHRTRPP